MLFSQNIYFYQIRASVKQTLTRYVKRCKQFPSNNVNKNLNA